MGQNMGQFALSWYGLQTLGAHQVKIFSHIASRRNRRTILAVFDFEVKKEIPVNDALDSIPNAPLSYFRIDQSQDCR